MNEPTPTKPKSDFASRKIGALWIRNSTSGNKYLGGQLELKRGETIEKINIMVMKNNSSFKIGGDKKPDYEIFIQLPKENKNDGIIDDGGL